MLAVKGGLRWQMILQANLEMVLCTDCVSTLLWLPGTVSVTTKSIGLSVERPICKGNGIRQIAWTAAALRLPTATSNQGNKPTDRGQAGWHPKRPSRVGRGFGIELVCGSMAFRLKVFPVTSLNLAF